MSINCTKTSILLLAGALTGLLSPGLRASSIDLYDFALHTSTGVSGDWQDASTSDPTTIIDTTSTIYNSHLCCGDASGGTTPGLGTVNYTFHGAPGSYSVTLYFDYDASTPNFNEYGTIHNGGSAQTGLSYEVFNANSTGTNIMLYGAKGVAGGETYGNANGTNTVPGTTDNFLATCKSASCNADVGMALTYTFTLSANEYALLSAISSTTDPGGFSLETTHPVDANNTTASNVYLTGDFSIKTGTPPPPPPSVPEPATWTLMGTALALLAIGRGRRIGRTV